MLSPVPFSKLWKSLLEFVGTSAFELLHHLGYGDVWWDRNKEMDMISSNGSGDNLDLLGTCYLSDKVSEICGNISFQDRISILGYPTDMIFEIIESV